MSHQFHIVTVDSGNSATGRDIQIWLDGMPLKGVREFRIDSNINGPIEMTFTIIGVLGDVPNKVKP